MNEDGKGTFETGLLRNSQCSNFNSLLFMKASIET